MQYDHASLETLSTTISSTFNPECECVVNALVDIVDADNFNLPNISTFELSRKSKIIFSKCQQYCSILKQLGFVKILDNYRLESPHLSKGTSIIPILPNIFVLQDAFTLKYHEDENFYIEITSPFKDKENRKFIMEDVERLIINNFKEINVDIDISEDDKTTNRLSISNNNDKIIIDNLKGLPKLFYISQLRGLLYHQQNAAFVDPLILIKLKIKK